MRGAIIGLLVGFLLVSCTPAHTIARKDAGFTLWVRCGVDGSAFPELCP